jgi:hypothetical protein
MISNIKQNNILAIIGETTEAPMVVIQGRVHISNLIVIEALTR